MLRLTHALVRHALALPVLLALALLAPVATGQTPPAPADETQASAEPELTIASATAELEQLETSALVEERKATLTELWREVVRQLETEENLQQQEAGLLQRRDDAPADLEVSRAEFEALPQLSAAPDLSAAKGQDSRQLQVLIDQAVAEELTLDAEVVRLREVRTTRATRGTEIPNELAARRAEVELGDEPEREADDPLEAKARRALASARSRALAAQIAVLEAERASYEARRDLLTLKQDLALRRLSLAQAYTEALKQEQDRVRLAERSAEAREAEQALEEAQDRHPLLLEVAAKRSELSQRALELESLQNADEDRLEDVQLEVERLTTEYEDIERRVERLGLGNALGHVLRRNRQALPDLRGLGVSADGTSTAEAQELLLLLEDERNELTDLDRWVSQRLSAESDTPEREALAADLRAQAASYRQRLDEALSMANRRFETLAELDGALYELEQLVDEYGAYIDARILWVPDSRAVSLEHLRSLPGDLRALFDVANFDRVGAAIAQGSPAQRTGDLLGVLLLVLALLIDRPMRPRLAALADRARSDLGHLTPSLAVLVYTLVRAAAVPLAIWLIGVRLERHADLGEMGLAFQVLGPALSPMTLLATICTPEGLAVRHFRWPTEACVELRRSMRRLAVALIPLLLPLGLLATLEDPALEASVGRALRLVFVLLAGWAMARMLRQDGPAHRIQATAASEGRGPSMRVWGLRSNLLAVLALMGLLVTGHQYAAVVIVSELLDTSALILLLVIARNMGLLALANQARVLRHAQRRRNLEASGGEDDGSAAPDPAEIDVALVSNQARQLMRAGVTVAFLLGLLAIWAQVLPALGKLDDVVLFQRSVEVSVVPEGAVDPVLQTVTQVLSLGDVLTSLLSLVLMIVLVRNLPGLVDIAILSRLTLEPGTGYAVRAVLRYTLIFVGVMAVLGSLGITWESMQWAVAAVSVGLGFGLQEVFANFVCGLILLFERPVRVGDIITVGGVDGVVQRIQIRATTLKDWNRKEMLIPNKAFVTEQVTNWTLSDPVTRLVFKVGLAYGSDTDLATQTLMEVARAEPLVLDAPAPSVVFRCFGDSTLDFDLRVFINDYDQWPKVTHAVNMAIDQSFRKAGLEIAFPQRDVHIKVKELGAAVAGGGRSAEVGGDA